MAKQNERRPHEVQPKSSLSIPPGMRAYYRGLQNSMEPSGATSKRGKVITVFVSAQRARRPSKVKGSEECFFKAPVRHN